MKGAILFDLDGTLTDPREGITRSIAHALERMGRQPPPLDELTFAIGPPLRHSLATLLGSDEPAAVERALAHYRERFADVGLFENTPYESIAHVLQALAARGHRLFVATSKPQVYAERIVRHFAFHGQFDAIHGCELDGTREDKRDLLEHLLATHGLRGGDCVMVGDRGVDMRAARHHGARGFGALWGYGSRSELESHGAHLCCDGPMDLLDAISEDSGTAPI
jgi:phosphoglycolate phosphatase